MPEMDIEKITARWVKRYGDEAPEKARQEAAAFGRAGDKTGAEIMRQVSEVAENILKAD